MQQIYQKRGTYPVHINGRKHVLKHGGHEFDLHAIRPKVVEDEKRMMSELLLVHPVLLQRRDHVFDERVLRKNKTKKMVKVIMNMGQEILNNV